MQPRLLVYRSQIPLLGDIPIIGVAFRKTSDRVTRQEVIILLTPHIISEPEETNSIEREEDISRKKFGSKEELQWFSRSRMAEDNYEIAAKLYIKGDTAGAMSHLNAALALRPSYLEAIRLKERILSETNPDEINKLGRRSVDKINEKVSPDWKR